jgi:hypothetical protein
MSRDSAECGVAGATYKFNLRSKSVLAVEPLALHVNPGFIGLMGIGATVLT